MYRSNLEELDTHIARSDMVLGQLDESRGLLSEMEANYKFVEENSRTLQLACETMMDEQVRGTLERSEVILKLLCFVGVG